MMEGEIEGKGEKSPFTNTHGSYVDGARPPPQGGARLVSASQAASSIDPPGDIAHTGGSFRTTTTQTSDGIYKIKKQEPGEFDILCGRGRSFQDHSGNRLLRQMVQLNSELYKRAKRSEKAPIARTLVAVFNASGNHFLRRDYTNECWEAIDDEHAKEKVAHCFRSSTRVPPPSSSSSSSASTSMVVSSPPGKFEQLNRGRAAQLLVTSNGIHRSHGAKQLPPTPSIDAQTTSQLSPYLLAAGQNEEVPPWCETAINSSQYRCTHHQLAISLVPAGQNEEASSVMIARCPDSIVYPIGCEPLRDLQISVYPIGWEPAHTSNSQS
jgi:hypothetical protein